ncbi:MAG: DegT/DnrJ/EryC1/StrS family aminotransferase [Oligoflexia bacterium]|nr:DegT/DnrJ/EryC1/StrS family aminotransferase [Oligoflexia bacterium]
MKNIPITKPYIDSDDLEQIQIPLKTGWPVQGPFVAKFESEFAQFVKSPYALATSSCTTALHLALLALGIKKGDRVIAPSFTFIATQNSIEYCNAEVVFCDIELDTFNIKISEIEKILSEDKEKKIKAIIPVDLFGLSANLPAVIDLAKKFDLKTVEDAACSFGGYIGEQHSGTFADFGCFSFHPRKAITTGEGGMVICKDEKLASLITQLRNHGATKTDLQRHKEKGGSLLPNFNSLGFNYRMTDIQGAFGVSQIKKADFILDKRNTIASQYMKSLQNFSWLKLPSIPENYIHSFQSFVCLYLEGEDPSSLTYEKILRLNKLRNNYMEKLEERGIATRQGTHAVHTTDYYKRRYNLQDKQFINSFAADRLSITLPLYAEMSEEDFTYVIDHLKRLH